MILLARIVRLVTAVVVGVIVLGIALHLLDANSGNAVVSFVYDVGKWLVAPFKDVFHPDDAKARIAANWGLAAVVYGIAGAVISRLIARAALAGSGFGRRRPARPV